MLIVGDDRQTIFQFTGIENNTIETLTNALKAKKYIMPLSYRCPENVRETVLGLVPDFLSASHLESGETKTINASDIPQKLDHSSSFILARFNYELIIIALFFIKQGIDFRFHRPKYLEEVEGVIKSAKADDISDLIRYLETFENSEVSGKLKDSGILLKSLIDGLKIDSLHKLHSTINELFTDRVSGVSLATMHSVKGDEADCVIVLNTCKLDLSIFVDANLFYMSCTRSKRDLYFVNL